MSIHTVSCIPEPICCDFVHFSLLKYCIRGTAPAEKRKKKQNNQRLATVLLFFTCVFFSVYFFHGFTLFYYSFVPQIWVFLTVAQAVKKCNTTLSLLRYLCRLPVSPFKQINTSKLLLCSKSHKKGCFFIRLKKLGFYFVNYFLLVYNSISNIAHNCQFLLFLLYFFNSHLYFLNIF